MSCLPRLHPRFVSPFLHWVDMPAVPELHYTVYITGKPINFVKNIVSFQEEIFNSDTTANSEKGDVVLPAFPYESWANGWGSWKNAPARGSPCLTARLRLSAAVSTKTACFSTAPTCWLQLWLRLLLQVSLHQDNLGQLRQAFFGFLSGHRSAGLEQGGSQNNWKKQYQKKNKKYWKWIQ